MNIFKNTKLQVLIIVILTGLAYSNTLSSGFAIDDHLFVVDWQVTKDLKNIPLMFTQEFAPGLGEHSGVYRPLRTVFYAISFVLWGINPFFYHLQALFIHLGVTLLVYFITQKVMSSWFMVHRKKSTNYDLPARPAGGPTTNYQPFITALLFGLHPIHTEAISYITASFDSIAYIFFFGSFLLYLKSSFELPVKNKMYVISLVMAALAFFTLEMTLVLPLLIGFYEFLFRGKGKGVRVKEDSNISRLLPYFILAFVYLFIRVGVFHITSRAEYLGGSFYLTMLTMVQAWVRYIELLIWPVNLSINPTITPGINSWVGEATKMEEILNQSVISPQILGGLGILGALGVLGIKLRQKFPIISFSIFWFFICLLPVSYIIPQGPIMQERYIYLASYGFVLLLVYLIFNFQFSIFNKNFKFQILNYKTISIVLIILISSFYGIRTYARNKDWVSGASIWFSLIKQIPDDPYTNLVIGTYYEQNNNLEQASKYYENALKSKPDYQPAYQKLLEVNTKKGHVN